MRCLSKPILLVYGLPIFF
uniref:Uncharacterized protein n=2 Tax=Anguilla anguilla TaxID=7936 RepID=A0A0E9VGJ3_ANGAN